MPFVKTCCLVCRNTRPSKRFSEIGTVITDAGYGGEENYAYLESEQLEALVKYSTYHKEKSKKWKQDISKLDNWQYNEIEDT